MRTYKRIIFFCLWGLTFSVRAVCWSAEGDNGYPFTAKDRDPFSPLISLGGRILIPSDESVSNFVLKGIIYSQDTALAVINDEILKEGDKIGDCIVIKVEEKKVILKSGEEEVILKLEEE